MKPEPILQDYYEDKGKEACEVPRSFRSCQGAPVEMTTRGSLNGTSQLPPIEAGPMDQDTVT